MAAVRLSPRTLAETIALVKADTISSKIAKELLPALLAGEAEGEGGVAALVEERGMGQITDEAAVRSLIQAAMDANPKQLEQYRCARTPHLHTCGPATCAQDTTRRAGWHAGHSRTRCDALLLWLQGRQDEGGRVLSGPGDERVRGPRESGPARQDPAADARWRVVTRPARWCGARCRE